MGTSYTSQSNTSQSKLSLQQYLRDRLVLLGLLLVIIYGVAMTTLYSWGLDDASEFYLFHDAEVAENNIKNGLPLPPPTAFKKFIYGKENLPSEYLQLKAGTNEEPLLVHINFNNRFDYILKYPIKSAENKMLYVIHSFDSTNDLDLPGLSVMETIIIISSVALLFVLVMATSIYRAISQPVNTLYQWAKSLGGPHGNTPLEHLRFKELQTVGCTLEASLNNIIKISERERSFVRCLSHELRTPMAVVSAALDILDNKDIDAKIRAKTQKIREANVEMIEISDTLLQIWLTQETTFEKETLNIHSFLDSIINDNLYVKNNAKTVINNTIPAHIQVAIEKQPLLIILTNIIKNSLQYTSGGVIHLKADAHSITVTNPNPALASPNHSQDSVDYGFGLGLFIAETVAKQQSWELTCKQKGEEFTSTLSFP